MVNDSHFLGVYGSFYLYIYEKNQVWEGCLEHPETSKKWVRPSGNVLKLAI